MLEESHFRHAIERLPTHRRFKAIVGKELYPLTLNYYSRARQLCEWGVHSHTPLDSCFDQAFAVTADEKSEERAERLLEIATSVCQGAYWNKFLDDYRSREISRRVSIAAATGKQWETGGTVLSRRLMRMMDESRSDYLRSYNAAFKSVRSARLTELIARSEGDKRIFRSLEDFARYDRERMICEYFDGVGFARCRSSPDSMIFVNELAEEWRLLFWVDRGKLNTPIAIESGGERHIGTLEFLFGTGRVVTGERRLTAPDSAGQLLLRFEHFFPISRFPLADVFSTFLNASELALILETKLKMFASLRTELVEALTRGVLDAEAE
jgi:hypothetical protein